MLEQFVILLTAHLIADFPAQTDWMIRNKKNPLILLAHTAIVGVVSVLMLGTAPLFLLAVLLSTHLLMDAAKVYLMDDSAWSFAIDQIVHLCVILMLAGFFPHVLENSIWPDVLKPEELWVTVNGMVLISAIIAAIPAGGMFIQKAMRPFTSQIDTADQGLKDGGKYIGYLERGLILLLVISGNPEGVGFLIAAKSILRFGEIKDAQNRRMSEYIIIGTFMSFGWALAVGFLTAMALTPPS